LTNLLGKPDRGSLLSNTEKRSIIEIKMSEQTIHISPGSVVKAILIILLFVVLYLLRDLLLVVLAAVVLASAIEPITRWFKRYHIPRVLAVLLIYVCAAVILIGTFYFLFLPILNESSTFLENLPQYLSSAELWNPVGNSSFFGSQPFVQGLSENISVLDLAKQVNHFISSFSSSLLSTVSFVFGGLLSFILIVVLSFYLAVQENGIGSFLQTITPVKHRGYVLDLWRRSEQKIGLWLQGQVLLVVIIGVLTYLGLSLLGIEHALLLAGIAAIFELIPLFGPILSAIPAIGLAFFGGGISSALLVTGLYIIIQQFENQLIYPLVVKKVVGVPPIIVIVALVAGASLAGFLGLLLSVPVAAALMEIFHDLQRGVFAEKSE